MRRLLVTGILFCVMALTLTCVSPRRPNIVLIVVDTLRQDHLGYYGWHRNTSPALDALADDSVRFTNAYSTAPWTLPSVASIMTGLYPSTHGATQLRTKLSPALNTLAEILRKEGYATAGVVSHTVVSSRWNFQQGFDTFSQSEAQGHEHVSTPGVTRQAQQVLSTLGKGEKPFFLFVHYFDPHYDYIRHSEYGFAASRAGRLDGTQTIAELRELSDMTDEEINFIVGLYDEEIRFTDAGIGRLLKSLEESGHYDDTLIVFTADHGEEFMSHGWIGHTRTLYDELIKAPLLIREPGGNGGPRNISHPVSLVSITPTILDFAGVDLSDQPFQAGSLVPVIRSDDTTGDEVIFAEVDFIPLTQAYEYKTTHKKAIATRDFKLIRDDETGALELYHLVDDPSELHDLSMERPDLLAEMLPLLERAIARSRGLKAGPEELDLTPEEIERLRSLGYVAP